MKISEYGTADLVYQYVLFYNIPADKMRSFHTADASYRDHAILTYCYIDRMAGVTYEYICNVGIDGENVCFRKPDRTRMFKIREGGLISDAMVFPEGPAFAEYQDIVDSIKRNYGYYRDLVRFVKSMRFSNKRHICFPKDILVKMVEVGPHVENIWVTEIQEDEYPEQIGKLNNIRLLHTVPEVGKTEELTFAGAGRLINEPAYDVFGYHKGDIVAIFAQTGEEGVEVPVVVAKNMLP